MYLKKIKNNNRGADVALIGTNYILVLILVVCAIVDLMIIEYGKMTVVSVLKECETYALGLNYNHEGMFYDQQIHLTDDVARNIMNTCKNAFNGSIGGSNGYMENCKIITNGAGVNGSGIIVGISQPRQSLYITVPQVSFVPKKIFKGASSGTLIPFIGQGMKRMPSTGNLNNQQVHSVSLHNSEVIYTGASMKLAFIRQ